MQCQKRPRGYQRSRSDCKKSQIPYLAKSGAHSAYQTPLGRSFVQLKQNQSRSRKSRPMDRYMVRSCALWYACSLFKFGRIQEGLDGLEIGCSLLDGEEERRYWTVDLDQYLRDHITGDVILFGFGRSADRVRILRMRAMSFFTNELNRELMGCRISTATTSGGLKSRSSLGFSADPMSTFKSSLTALSQLSKRTYSAHLTMHFTFFSSLLSSFTMPVTLKS